MGLFSRVLGRLRHSGTQADTSSVRIVGMGNGVNMRIESVVDTRGTSYMKNVLILPPQFVYAPRTEQNLKKLIRYATRKYGKDPYDKRTRAYKFMAQHDSEWLSQRLAETKATSGELKNAKRKKN